MTNALTPREWEALSAYLDGELSLKERVRLETKLQERADLRAAVDDLRRTRAILRNQPAIRAPRNFTLKPEMVGLRSRRLEAPKMFQFLRFASVLASLLFIFVVVGDLYMNSFGVPAYRRAAEPVAQMEAAAEQEQAALGEESPVEAPPAAAMVAPEAADKSLGISQETPETALAMPYLEGGAYPPPAGTPGPPLAAESQPVIEEARSEPYPSSGTELPTSEIEPVPSAVAAAGEQIIEREQQQPEIEVPKLQEPTRVILWRLAEIVLAVAAIVLGGSSILLRRSKDR